MQPSLRTGLLFAGAANAASHSATRSINPTTAAPGEEAVVTITAAGLGSFGRVVETLPAGLSYVSSDAERVSNTGQEVSFTIFGDGATFTYTVEVDAGTQPGDYTISGVTSDFNRDSHAVAGHATITVTGTASSPTPEPTEEPTAVPGTTSATRSFSASTVDAGDSLDVTVSAANYGRFGRVVETLPAGFAYDSVSPADTRVNVSGQVVSFNLLGGDQSITYTVTASDTPGTFRFSGALRDEDNNSTTIGGASSVTVAGPRASRSFSPSPVTPDSTLRVTLSARDYGPFGRITETLPSGFTYQSVSPSDTRVSQSGRTLTFTIVGPNQTITYTASAPSAEGTYTFSGTLLDEDQASYTVGGSAAIRVAVAPPSALRTLSESTVTAGDDLEVTILALNYGRFARVIETIPEGFTYKSVDPASTRVAVSGQTLTFTVIGDAAFRYTVTASETPGSYNFSGHLLNEDNMLTLIAPSTVTVISAVPPTSPGGPFVPAPTPVPTETPVPPTATPVPPTATPVPPTATPVPPTATPVPPTATPVPPTATPVPPTATPVPPTTTPVPPTATPVPPTATPEPTATPVPPTATPVPPTATPVPPTATPVPPTATPVPPTATPVPPTATPVPPTATPVPPTATPVPPTATPVPPPPPQPTATPMPPVEEEAAGFPIWAIILIILAVLAAIAGGLAYVRYYRARQLEA